MTKVSQSLLDTLVPVILDAGQAVMSIYASDFVVENKDDKSPVTEADRKGEAIIKAGLDRIAPDIQMIGEESVSEDGAPVALEDRFWLVDPLDGTKEFINRGGDFTVNIGLIENGEPVLGLVLAPDVGTLYMGAKGIGAWCAPVKDGIVGDFDAITTRKPPHEPMTIVASKSHRSAALEAYLSHFPGAENISIGSSLKLCLLAAGKADLYPRLGLTCEWDTAAADAVLRAAGGITLAPDGSPLAYAKNPKTFLNSWFLAKADPAFSTPAFEQD